MTDPKQAIREHERRFREEIGPDLAINMAWAGEAFRAFGAALAEAGRRASAAHRAGLAAQKAAFDKLVDARKAQRGLS